MSERNENGPLAGTAPTRSKKSTITMVNLNPYSYMRGFQRGLVVALVLAGAVFGAWEVRNRITHVYEIDARVAGELITVSSRVSGWVDEIVVEEGDGIAKEQVLVRIDGRESKLLVDELEAQMRSVASERARLNAERRLIDEQTKSRYETQLSKMSAAEASVSALEPQLELALSELERAKSLFEKRVIPKQQLDQARATARRPHGGGGVRGVTVRYSGSPSRAGASECSRRRA